MFKRITGKKIYTLLIFLFFISFFYSCNKKIPAGKLNFYESVDNVISLLNENSITADFKKVDDKNINYINGLFSENLISQAAETQNGLSLIKLNNFKQSQKEFTESFEDEYIYFLQEPYIFSQYCNDNLNTYRQCLLLLNDTESVTPSSSDLNEWSINDFCNYILCKTELKSINLLLLKEDGLYNQDSVNYASITNQNQDMIFIVKAKDSKSAEDYGNNLYASDDDFIFKIAGPFVIALDTSCNSTDFYNLILNSFNSK